LFGVGGVDLHDPKQARHVLGVKHATCYRVLNFGTFVVRG
jgi:hypothetical protein